MDDKKLDELLDMPSVPTKALEAVAFTTTSPVAMMAYSKRVFGGKVYLGKGLIGSILKPIAPERDAP